MRINIGKKMSVSKYVGECHLMASEVSVCDKLKEFPFMMVDRVSLYGPALAWYGEEEKSRSLCAPNFSVLAYYGH